MDKSDILARLNSSDPPHIELYEAIDFFERKAYQFKDEDPSKSYLCEWVARQLSDLRFLRRRFLYPPGHDSEDLYANAIQSDKEREDYLFYR